MQLELEKQTAILLAFTPRTEHHGPELESRATLKFLANVGADFLLEIDPRLRTMLYEKADDAQEELLEDVPLTKLRIPALSPNFPLKSDWKGIGYQLDMDVGVTGKSNISLDLCNVDKIRYTPKDGGTVELTFNVACDPSEHDVGTIYNLMGKEVLMWLTPPSAEKIARMNKASEKTEPLFKDEPAPDSKDAQVAELNKLFGPADGEEQAGDDSANDDDDLANEHDEAA
ncbi:MAG: hypothetical protein JWN23_1126 [Rhodocyclales bacterium]|nr:hypothetical protein [Rhodocyclales bacterium]